MAQEMGLIDKALVAVVIPVFNHEGKVAQVVRETMKLHMPVFVIDDGSTDSTYSRIKDISSLSIIRHESNKGKGAAILTGFAAAFP